MGRNKNVEKNEIYNPKKKRIKNIFKQLIKFIKKKKDLKINFER